MSDQKISALSALTGANLASGDKIPVVDVSDTTMAASGTDKAMTAAELAAGLASLGQTGIIKYKRHGITSSYSTTSGTLADIDATNVVITFTVPSSGKVLVKIAALWILPTSANAGTLYLREGSTTLKTKRVGNGNLGAGANLQMQSVVPFEVTGLTPGSSLTYKFSWATTGDTFSIAGIAGQDTDVIITVEALPA